MSQDNNDLIHKEALHEWVQKDKLINTAAVSLNGPPEIKKEEKMRFLGEFQERVIKALTKEQVSEKDIFPEIIKAMESEKADKLIINGSLRHEDYHKYEELGKNLNIKTTINHDPGFIGNVGLVVVSNEAVNEENIFIDRKNPIANNSHTNSTADKNMQHNHLLQERSLFCIIKDIINALLSNKNKI